MLQPEGFIDPNKPSHVCSLTKALYGLKQAPRAWFDTFSNFLLEFGFECSKSDPSLFTYHHKEKTLLLLLYVDDILLTGNSEHLIQDLLKSLNTRFSMKDLGKPKYFLGIQIEETEEGLFLHQEGYATDILHQAGMSDYNPMPTHLPIVLDDPESELFPEPTYFRSLAGKLQYLTITRPDIQFAVNFVCQRMHAPTVADFGLLKRTLRYVKGTLRAGLDITSDPNMPLTAFCDRDWSGCKDTRRSTAGFCIFVGSTILSWSAKRQDTVSHSSTEAEYRALTTTARELTWVSNLLRDLKIAQHQAIIVHCDNLSAVYLSTNPALHRRSKHFQTDYHYIREQVAFGFVETKHIPSSTQIADIFTKSLPRRTFLSLRDKLGVSVSPDTSLRGNVKKISQTGQSKTEEAKGGPSQKEQNKTKDRATVQRGGRSSSTEKEELQLCNRFDALCDS